MDDDSAAPLKRCIYYDDAEVTERVAYLAEGIEHLAKSHTDALDRKSSSLVTITALGVCFVRYVMKDLYPKGTPYAVTQRVSEYPWKEVVKKVLAGGYAPRNVVK